MYIYIYIYIYNLLIYFKDNFLNKPELFNTRLNSFKNDYMIVTI